MLKSAIPEEVWAAHTCLVVHPGPVGDRGPSSLDWAIHEGVDEWGVTVLQADGEMDAGDVWACVPCRLPRVSKSELYRGEIADAALEAVLLAVARFAGGTHVPCRQDTVRAADARLRPRPYLDQSVRRIDWAEDATGTVLRKLRAADSQPGVLDTLLGGEWYLHGGHPESVLRGRPGEAAGDPCRSGLPGHRGRRRVDPGAAGQTAPRAAADVQTARGRGPRRPAAAPARGAGGHLDGHPLPGER